MKLDDLIPAWRSSHNIPDPAQIEEYKAHVVARLGKEYRDFLWFTGMAVGMTLFLAGGFVEYLRSGGAFDWQREWASVVFLLFPVGVAALFVRGYVGHRQRHPRYDVSIADALRAAIDQNRLARLRLRVSMIATTLAMMLVPVVTHQLQLVGKQRPHEAASMLVVFGVGYVVAIGCQAWIYRRKLLPERARLQELLSAYR